MSRLMEVVSQGELWGASPLTLPMQKLEDRLAYMTECPSCKKSYKTFGIEDGKPHMLVCAGCHRLYWVQLRSNDDTVKGTDR